MKVCIFVVKALLIAALAVGISINAFADCSDIFGTGKFRFMYGSYDQQVFGSVSQCGENSCFEGVVDFGSHGRQRLNITYDGSTWWADWYDTSNGSLWLMGTCQGSTAQGKGGYKGGSGNTQIYSVTIKH